MERLEEGGRRFYQKDNNPVVNEMIPELQKIQNPMMLILSGTINKTISADLAV